MEKTCENCGHNTKAQCEPYSQGKCSNPELLGELKGAMWKPKETGIKEVVFGPEHVGSKVYSTEYGNGEIIEFQRGTYQLPVLVFFKEADKKRWYTKTGKRSEIYIQRSLFVGHNVKITVEEDDLSEKLICPVCGVEHIISSDGEGLANYFFDDLNDDCPLNDAYYCAKEDARNAMRNLIKAMS